MSGEIPTVGRRFQVEWLGLLVGGAVVASVGTHLVTTHAGVDGGRRWLAVAGGVLVYEMGFLAYHLVLTRGGGSLLVSGLGMANVVTLLRGVLFAAAAGFMFVPPTTPAIRWAPGLCYGAGAALDYVDGKLARRTGNVSELGARLDHAFDTLGFLVAPLVGVLWGRLPVVYLTLSGARYCFRAGTAWRRYSGRPVFPLPESRLRRRLAAFQMVVITVALLPVLPVAIVHPVATVALVPSLAWFLRDWLAVSGGSPWHEE